MSEMPEVIKFLLGEGQLDGYSFGEFPDNGEKHKRRYWWRSALREYVEARRQPDITDERIKAALVWFNKANWDERVQEIQTIRQTLANYDKMKAAISDLTGTDDFEDSYEHAEIIRKCRED